MYSTNNKSSCRVFVVGVGRSGTSLLQAILGSHPDVQFFPESGFLRRYVIDGRFNESPAEFWDHVRSDERLSRLKPNWKEIAAEDSAWLSLTVYEKLTSSENKFTGDKDPRLVESISCLLNLWKDCRIIHLYRDPRDVLASKKKAAWSKGRSLLFHLVAGAAQYSLAKRVESSSHRLIHLKYENLISSPEPELKGVCDWLGLAYREQMLDFGETAKQLTSAQEVSWKKETFGPLLRSNEGKWKESLSEIEVRSIEVACCQVMKDGNYKPSAARLSWIQRLIANSLGLSARFIAAVYVLRVGYRNESLISRAQR